MFFVGGQVGVCVMIEVQDVVQYVQEGWLQQVFVLGEDGIQIGVGLFEIVFIY